MLFSLPFFGTCTCWHGFVSLWSWGCGKGGGGEESLGPVLAEPHFSQSLTCPAGHWLEFPMGCVGCYLVKLDTANCAKESHQADIQHQLKEGKDHVLSWAAKRPSFPQKHKAWGLVCPLMPFFGGHHLSLSCWVPQPSQRMERGSLSGYPIKNAALRACCLPNTWL